MEGTSSPSQWIIGYFPKEHKYSVIPMNWLSKCGDSYYCKWPNMKVSPTMLRNAALPTSKWTSHPVRVVERYDNYEDAASREVEIYLTSGGETDIGDMGQENRRKILKTFHKSNDDSIYIYNFLGSDSDTEPLSILKTTQNVGINNVSDAVNILYNMDGIPPNLSHDTVQETAIYSPSTTHKVDPIANNNTDDLAVDVSLFLSSTSSTIAANNIVQGQNCSSSLSNQNYDNIINKTADISSYWPTKNSKHDINSADYNKMEKVTSANTLYMERIDKKLDIILNILQKNQTNSVPLTTVDTNFLNYFPLKELEALKDLEEKLKTDNEFKSKLVNLITSIGGTNVKHFVKRVLTKLFSNQLASHCSWTGFKNDCRLDGLEMIKTMKNICIGIFQNDENSFEIFITDWFRHAAQRLKRDITDNDSSKKKDHN
ncbi:uncharacterized protein LOC107885092 [Acyrthosiphon pisum]|uniref:DUF4806 domain-containing protein n=1 Tax=Acyrthosiphon pisum TaxID=7029 RepID=A0A8R2D6I5_ACYPI|nr:uncharacterized protein LOC107885092 [Acyrthosiphon pisum]